MRGATEVGFLRAGGHPGCRRVLARVSAGSAGLVWGGHGTKDLSAPKPGAPIAAAVITMEPIAYQVKGDFQGWHLSLGRKLGVIEVREAYSACPPLPGSRLPAVGTPDRP